MTIQRKRKANQPPPSGESRPQQPLRGITTSNLLPANFLEEMDLALRRGEDYETFEARLFVQMGIASDEPAGALEHLEQQMLKEVRQAWNDALKETRREVSATAPKTLKNS